MTADRARSSVDDGIPSEIREMLVCPVCRGALIDVRPDGRASLACPACAIAYPIEDGIPVLLRERATQWQAEI